VLVAATITYMDVNHCPDYGFKFVGFECQKECSLTLATQLQEGTGIFDEQLMLLGSQALNFKRLQLQCACLPMDALLIF
jgi:hypothetical protein